MANKLSIGIAGVAIVGLILGAAYFGVFSIGGQNPGSPADLPISISVVDVLAGSQDATTTKVAIYKMEGGNPVLQETVTVDSANKDSTLKYKTGEVLYLHVYDSTDTSLCTQYLTWTVPPADAAAVYNGKFQLDIDTIDRGDTAIDTFGVDINGTTFADAASIDCSNSGYDSAYAYLTFTARQPTDDKGYYNSYNFLRGYGNYHGYFLSFSGTGWNRVVLLSSGFQTFERNNVLYVWVPMDDEDLTRDKQADDSYDPLGKFEFQITLDLTAITTGDSVTATYGYRYYADWDHFKATGSWGSNAATSPATAETWTITP